MPRQIVVAPGHDRSRSLGWLGLAWLEFFVVHGPGDVQGQPIEHGDEYSAFIADCYALDGVTGRRLYDSAFLSRPKGCDKSGLGARLALFEGLGPCRVLRADPLDPESSPVFAEGGEVYRDPWGLGFEYVYAAGEPMGRPVQSPFIRCMATEEGQTGNVYDSIYYNLTEGPLAAAMSRRDDAGLSRILLPGGGEITPSTASSAAKDGGKETFVVLDETHLYTTPQLRQMYKTVTRNLRKRKLIAETWFLETTTMFEPGQGSIAEDTLTLAEAIREGKTSKGLRGRLLFDHRWGEIDPESLADVEALSSAIVEAYGDAVAWNHPQGIVDEFFDPRADVEDSMRYFLNTRTGAKDAFVSAVEWEARHSKHHEVDPLLKGDVITLGFDGSRGRAREKPDATALVGCRVRDGHVFQIDVWEAGPDRATWSTWTPPIGEIEARIKYAFDHYSVAAFYCDPARDWRSHVNAWEAKYGSRVKVKARRDHPFEWWMNQGRSGLVQQAVEQFEGAIRVGDLTHPGDYDLTAHVLHARRRIAAGKLRLAKESEWSAKKIDAAVAAVLAWQARLDAVAAGVLTEKRKSTKFGRIR